MAKDPDPVGHARLAHEVIELLGGDYTPEKFRETFLALGKGLPGEYEFASLAVWGGATLVQSVDAGRWTGEAAAHLKVPDLLLVVADPKGNEHAFWVEVKTSSKARVKVSQRYRERMLKFQRVTGLPYLIALKHPFGMWILREVEALPRNEGAYIIDLDDMKESLMGLLLNEFTFHAREGLAFTTVLERTNPRPAGESEVMMVRDVYFHDLAGERLDRGPKWWLAAFSSLNPDDESQTSDSQVNQTFRATSGMSWSSQILAHQAALGAGDDDPVRWRKVLETVADFPPPSEVSSDLLDVGWAKMIGLVQPASATINFGDFVRLRSPASSSQ